MADSPSLTLILFFSCILFRTGSSQITTSTSASEQLFWTQGLPEPNEDTATVILASRTSTSLIPTLLPTATPDPATCNATSISCPSCHGTSILDSQNHAYHIFCANKLYSDSPFPVQRWLSPSGCLDECHKYPWCKGVTSRGEGNCQLARGENVFPQADGDGEHIAMLRIPDGYVPEPPATVPSAFPTGSVPIPTPSSPAASGRPGHCDLRDVECPYSRGEMIQDGYNASYTVRCNFQPMCRSFVSVEGRQSKCSCLANCDQDDDCLAALFNRGRCDLCHGSLEGLSTYTSPRNYIVFVSETPETDQTMTSSDTASTSTSLDSSPPRLTPSSLSLLRPSTTSLRSTRTSSTSRRSTSTRTIRRTTSTTRSLTARRTSTSTIPSRRTTSAARITSLGRTLAVSSSRRRSTTTIRSTSTPRNNTRSQATSATAQSRSSTSSGSRSTSSTSTTGRSVSTISWAPSITPSPTPTPPPSATRNPANLPPISSAACPEWDNTNVYAPSNDRNYIIQCDAAFGAAITNVTSAEDFASCAGECRGECRGIVYNAPPEDGVGEAEDCTLYTGISLIQSQAGATAGVWVRFPGTIRASITSTSVASAAAVDALTTTSVSDTFPDTTPASITTMTASATVSDAVVVITTTTTTSVPDEVLSAISAASSWVAVVPSLAAEEGMQRNK